MDGRGGVASAGAGLPAMVYKEGWLAKRGHVFSTLRKRYFVLDGSTLAYFGAVGDKAPKGVISLVGASLSCDGGSDDEGGGGGSTPGAATPAASRGGTLLGGRRGAHYSFTLVERPKAARLSEWGASGGGGGGSDGGPTKVFYLLAPTDRERAAWLEAIQVNITIASVDLVGGPIPPPTAAVTRPSLLLSPPAATSAAASGAAAAPQTPADGASSRAARVAAAARRSQQLGDGGALAGSARSSVVSGDLAVSASLTPVADALLGPSSLPSLSLGGGGGAESALFAGHGQGGDDALPLHKSDTLGAVTEVPLPLQGGAAASSASSALPACVRIWAGTWNMAEIAPPPGAMAALLPPGCDVYAFGLQECMHTDALLGALRAHLGEGYLEVHHRVGSTIKRLGYHGHIAVAVYVKEWMVASGFCRLSRAVRGAVALGKNLVITRAANKGAVAVALPIRLPDGTGALTVPSALVFVSCHLTSDASGKTKLKTRNANAHAMLQQLGLALTAAAITRAQTQTAVASRAAAALQAQHAAAAASAAAAAATRAAPVADSAASGASAAATGSVPTSPVLGGVPLARRSSLRSLGSGAGGRGGSTADDAILRGVSLSGVTVATAPGTTDGEGGGDGEGDGADGPDDDDVDLGDEEGGPDAADGGDGGGIRRTVSVSMPQRARRRSTAAGSFAVATGIDEEGGGGFASDTSTGQGDLPAGGGATFVRPAGAPEDGDDDFGEDDEDEEDDGSATGGSSHAGGDTASVAEDAAAAIAAATTGLDDVTASGPGRPTGVTVPLLPHAPSEAAAPSTPAHSRSFSGPGSGGSGASRLMPRTQSLRSLLPSSTPAAHSAAGDGAGSMLTPSGSDGFRSPTGSTPGGTTSGGKSSSGAAAANPLGISPGRSYVIIIGDLNYRVQLTPEEALAAIVSAGKAELAVGHRPPGSGSLSSSYSSDAVDWGAFNQYPEEGSWTGLLAHEQLRAALHGGTAFPGFAEPPILFPPSYRRRKSAVPLLVRANGDWASLDAVRGGFSTVVHKKKEKNPTQYRQLQEVGATAGDGHEGGGGSDGGSSTTGSAAAAAAAAAAAGVRPGQLRTPSYTDRVLLRCPLLTGVPVALEDFQRDRARRKSKRLSMRAGSSGSAAHVAGAPAAAAAAAASGLSAAEAAAEDSWFASSRHLDRGLTLHSTASSGGGGRAAFVPFPPLRCVTYDACENVIGSDHVPIAALFELPLTGAGRGPDWDAPSPVLPMTPITGAVDVSGMAPLRPPFPIVMPTPLSVFEAVSLRSKHGRPVPLLRQPTVMRTSRDAAASRVGGFSDAASSRESRAGGGVGLATPSHASTLSGDAAVLAAASNSSSASAGAAASDSADAAASRARARGGAGQRSESVDSGDSGLDGAGIAAAVGGGALLPVDAMTLRLAEKASVAPAPPPQFELAELDDADEGAHVASPHPAVMGPAAAQALLIQGAAFGAGKPLPEPATQAALRVPPVVLPWAPASVQGGASAAAASTTTSSSADGIGAVAAAVAALEPTRRTWPSLYHLSPPPPPGTRPIVGGPVMTVSLPPGAPAELARVPLALLPPAMRQRAAGGGQAALLQLAAGSGAEPPLQQQASMRWSAVSPAPASPVVATPQQPSALSWRMPQVAAAAAGAPPGRSPISSWRPTVAVGGTGAGGGAVTSPPLPSAAALTRNRSTSGVSGAQQPPSWAVPHPPPAPAGGAASAAGSLSPPFAPGARPSGGSAPFRPPPLGHQATIGSLDDSINEPDAPAGGGGGAAQPRLESRVSFKPLPLPSAVTPLPPPSYPPAAPAAASPAPPEAPIVATGAPTTAPSSAQAAAAGGAVPPARGTVSSVRLQWEQKRLSGGR